MEEKQDFLLYLNRHVNIQILCNFTMEIVNKDTLAFLKVLIKRHIIYRKKMHMDWSLHTTILIRNKRDFL